MSFSVKAFGPGSLHKGNVEDCLAYLRESISQARGARLVEEGSDLVLIEPQDVRDAGIAWDEVRARYALEFLEGRKDAEEYVRLNPRVCFAENKRG